MAWVKKHVRFSGSMPSVICSELTVQPYLYGVGQQTETGCWLSPVNAISWLSGRLSTSGGAGDLLLMMICGGTAEAYREALALFSGVIPLPSLTQSLRQFDAAARLQIERMRLPAKIKDGLPPAVELLFSTGRQASAAGLIDSAQAAAGLPLSEDALSAALSSFMQDRQALIDGIMGGLDELTTQTATAWVFSGNGLFSQLAKEMLEDIPESTAVLCTAVMFTGDDLSVLRGLTHDIDNTGA